MSTLLDTDVAIELRDDDAWVRERVSRLTAPLHISAITRVELESGVHREPEEAALKRARLDRMLATIATLDFGPGEIAAYRRILEATGYSRRKTADRITAATALVHGLPLVTLNGRDFRDVPGLELIEWERGGD
jgi:predicted nucleic acid-binding protein